MPFSKSPDSVGDKKAYKVQKNGKYRQLKELSEKENITIAC